jgi:hypothetical protein
MKISTQRRRGFAEAADRSLGFVKHGAARRHLDIGDPSGRPHRLPQKIHRRGTQQQDATGGLPATPSGVDRSTQRGEEFRHSLCFVENDELVFMPGKIKDRIA